MTGDQKAGDKRKRPSAKEARARMVRAVVAEAPMSRTDQADPEPAGRTPNEARGPESGPGSDAERLVRLSVDVPRSKHRFLRVMAAQEGVSGMAVVRALIDELRDDEELAQRVRGRLAAEGR